MHSEASEPRATDGSRLQRAVVLELLTEAEPRLSLIELGHQLEAQPAELEAAVAALAAAGVVCLAEGRAWASPAARYLDELELIGI